MDSTELQILRRARELISDPERWTHGAYARSKDGHDVPVDDPRACRWCAVGAITKAAIDQGWCDGEDDDAIRALYDAHSGLRGGMLFDFNDDEGHAAVLALFDKALSEKETA